ncbi:MAG: hypothetical protein HY398_02135 [Candidatus Doudnabacteria bacterium]|nr:hypothetical protein [Candidatus Doudnabacteria bacterium]
MNPQNLANWSVGLGFLGVLLYIIAFVLLWQGGGNMLLGRFDQKDLYFAGSGLLYIAIWMKLGAIYHK